MLLPSAPTKLDSGARIRNAGLLGLLREDHHVDVLAFGAPDSAAEGMQLVPPPARSRARRVVETASSKLPDMAQRLWSPAFAEAVRCRLDRGQYDAVQAEGIEMARYLGAVPPERRVYDAHNAEFLLQQRLAARAAGAHGLYSHLQWRRLERFEGSLVRQSRLTLAVSEHDANQLLALGGGGSNVKVIPNAIDVGDYAFRPPPQQAPPSLLFLGKLDFRPNAEALAWFIPEVLRHLDSARLFAVGAQPPPWLVKVGQHDQRVAVTGYVADERSYFARCTALVLPLRTGAGSRLKALVAMASGLPIVSTRLGMEGLEAEPGRDYLLADSAADCVASLRRVLSDAALRHHLACNARALVEERYDWSVMRERMRAAYGWLGR
jgi:glycosyltransferase involved in cell wall biosynthesis